MFSMVGVARAGQKSISATFDSRPDKLRIRRTGGYADVELSYDGKALTINVTNAKSYVRPGPCLR
jgi:hypothetical protein